MEKTFVVDEDNVKKRLDVFLEQQLDFSRSQIKNFIEDGQVFVNEIVVKAGHKLKLGDKVFCKEFELKEIDLTPQDIKLDIVFENQDFAVINKPQKMVVHPAAGNFDGTLVNALLFHFKTLSQNDKVRPGIVHRLDKDTSGLLLVAKNSKAHNLIAQEIKDRKVAKKYLALCSGYFSEKQGQIVTGIGRDEKNRKKMAVYKQDEKKLAITNYKVLQEFVGFSLVEFELVTGRTHQIRVHASHLKHPIVGDELYGGNTKLYKGGQLLHSYFLKFVYTADQKEYVFESALPEYFQKIVDKLEKEIKETIY